MFDMFIVFVMVVMFVVFFDVFNWYDVYVLMGFMIEDCVFDVVGGFDIYGMCFVGCDVVCVVFEVVFKIFFDVYWGYGCYYVVGEWGVFEWVFIGMYVEGWCIEVEGCDLFEFCDGLIVVKCVFCKEWLK